MCGEVTDIRYMVESRLCYVGVDQSGVTWLVANGCTSPAIVTPAVVYTGVAIHNSYIRVIRFSPCATHPHISQLLPNNTSHHHKNRKKYFKYVQGLLLRAASLMHCTYGNNNTHLN